MVVRVFPDFLVTPNRAKDSLEYLVTPGNQVHQDTLDQRENLVLWDSPAWLDRGVMTAHLVSMEILEKMADQEAKVLPERAMVIPEDRELKDNPEIQASQAGVRMTALPVTTVSQEVQATPDQREVQVMEAGLE